VSHKRAFTLIELLVVIAIIAILAAILFPVFAKAREKARTASCLSNVKQISLGILQYCQDYDETYPCNATTRWYNSIQPCVMNTQVLVCPDQQAWRGYGTNLNVMAWDPALTLAAIPRPAGTSLVCDAAQCNTADVTGPAQPPSTWNLYETGATDWQYTTPGAWNYDGALYYTYDDQWGNESRRPVPRHSGGLNVGYCDGHAKWMDIDAFLGPMTDGWPYGDQRNSWQNQ
jgi:prepilin-type N-terminal cleavage/methylation domain-containing protein/prepilin-type processing-associated H-X9-DG protein